jgi:hypothetical protein
LLSIDSVNSNLPETSQKSIETGIDPRRFALKILPSPIQKPTNRAFARFEPSEQC